ncbi:MAG: glycine--tRNA ligase [Bacteroidetes Order II. Incertae sedis bacterium]|nr:glycine--tRNA ligase [Bacteroidetes Order II. bacterium]MDG1753972.1 glycine--tRNA ligase [Rhodothermales bacterium]HAY35878.1 glycine--tRNA ligase [Bacteroidota bacterium]MBT4052197.1 glycine--tRNA ligase [Bacteroidetes Order II. bacterium]MBT5248837.1 glycine--tRNA ligase [Bacteroidetes Order II. bacterium]
MSDLFEKIVSLSKRRGFIFQSSEIYGGLSATYDYGPLGVELKRNVTQRWWNAMVYRHQNVSGLDAAILMHPKTWKASGHVDAFSDPLIDDKTSKMRYRADQLIEGYIDRLRRKGKDETADRVYQALVDALNAEDMSKALHDVIMAEEIRSPDSGMFDWTDVRQFNLMFDTHIGPVQDADNKIYLRPETAQGIFVNFHNVRETGRHQVPFGIAQIGKAFRNEIVARQFIFRMREFEQMEMQYFVKPGSQMEAFEQWREERMQWHIDNGIRPSKLRWHEHEKLAHYADAAFDIQYEFPIGWQEVEGIHSRTDFDLRAHQDHSGKKMEYFDPRSNEKYLPYVVETSAGLDRTVLTILCEAYREEEVDGDTRSLMKFHPKIAPITAAIFPLVKKNGMPEVARKIQEDLQQHFHAFYDEKGAIGRRYRRMDEVGTPFCVTVDGESVEEGSVTVRHRDTMEQDRIPAENVAAYMIDAIRDWKP